MRRKFPICTEETYHIYTKSIYKYKIFDSPQAFQRIHQLIQYYQYAFTPLSFSVLLRTPEVLHHGFDSALERLKSTNQLEPRVQIIAFCYMPTHIHIIAKQLTDDGIMLFMHQVLTAYTKYFNKLHNRKGPLWQERFGASRIRTAEELMVKIAYLHINPIRDLQEPAPDSWPYSSYRELTGTTSLAPLCEWPGDMPWTAEEYLKFFKSYQTLYKAGV